MVVSCGTIVWGSNLDACLFAKRLVAAGPSLGLDFVKRERHVQDKGKVEKMRRNYPEKKIKGGPLTSTAQNRITKL